MKLKTPDYTAEIRDTEVSNSGDCQDIHRAGSNKARLLYSEIGISASYFSTLSSFLVEEESLQQRHNSANVLY